MKKITAFLLTAMFILSSAVFADDNENLGPQPPAPPPSYVSAMPKSFKAPKMPSPPPGVMGMMQQTVVATSDGGIVIVEGNKITKLDKNLEFVKSVELKDTVSGKNSY